MSQPDRQATRRDVPRYTPGVAGCGLALLTALGRTSELSSRLRMARGGGPSDPYGTVEEGSELRSLCKHGLTLHDLTGSRFPPIRRIKELHSAGRLDDVLRIVDLVDGRLLSRRWASEACSSMDRRRSASRTVPPRAAERSRALRTAHGLGPRDSQFCVVVAHREVTPGIVGLVDSIAKVGGFRKDLKAVQEARGNVKVKEVFVIQPECLVPTEHRRCRSRVDDDVVYGAASAAAPASLLHLPLPCKTAKGAAGGTRLRVLHECAWI